jgi:nitroreductase/NAD-dependent dihydropyrimidine dehydrogenase PreA subunit
MEDIWFIDELTCKGCASCVDLCPNRILQKDEAGKIYFREDRTWECFRCGHCMAVCPTQSVHVPGLSYEKDFYALEKLSGKENEDFQRLISTRRAVRCFQNKPVPRDLLEQVVQAIKQAPPAFPPHKTELTVVENTELIRESLPMMITLYEDLIKAVQHPIARHTVRRKIGSEKFITLKNHLIPLLIERMPDLKSGKEDTILRRAPAMILFHANRNSENYRTDILIALTYGILAAHALGLGASAMDLIPPAVERNPELRRMFQIPEENEVVASIILGYPKHHFQRGIRRELKSVTWL